MSKFQRLLWSLPALALFMLLSTVLALAAERAAPAGASAEAEVRQAVRGYDEALRNADITAVEKFWASEYKFINAQGERLTRDDRLANLRTKRTALGSLAHAPQDERIQVYGDMALYTTLLTLSGRYSGKAQQGQFRALVVWVRRDGRWQQLASQMTPIVAP
jgi:ketosteroid isomerase-like protein